MPIIIIIWGRRKGNYHTADTRWIANIIQIARAQKKKEARQAPPWEIVIAGKFYSHSY